MPISDEIKQAIRERAKYVCEYCHSPERLSANRFTIDHIVPKSSRLTAAAQLHRYLALVLIWDSVLSNSSKVQDLVSWRSPTPSNRNPSLKASP